MTRPDLSIAQRLSIGFGLLLLLLATVLAVVFTLQGRSDAAHDNFVERIEPRREVAQNLERSLLLLGLSARGYLLSGTPDALERYQAGRTALQRQIDALRAVPHEADDQARVDAMTPLLDAYLRTVEDVVEAARRGIRNGDSEEGLSAARDATLAQVRRFTELQEAKQAGALLTMRDARSDVERGLLFVSVASALGFLGLAWATARTIQRPARQLVHIAEAMRDGNLAPALEWAPAGPNGRGRAAPPRSEMTRLAQSFGAAAAALDRRHARLRADAMVTAAIGHSLHKREVADASLRAIAEHLDAEVGIIYSLDPTTAQLRAIATKAAGTVPVPDLRLDEGLPGAAAAQRRRLVVRAIPADTAMTINLGFGSLPPHSVVAAPIVFRDDLLGVLVLASLREFDSEALEFIDAVTAQLAVGL